MDETVAARIKQEIDDNQVVLFMKGTPVFPQCGFSAAAVQILSHLNVKFKGVAVLQDPGIRQGIKDFSTWPTTTQLYFKGEHRKSDGTGKRGTVRVDPGGRGT